MNYEKVCENEQSFRLLTSLTREEFAYILPTFEIVLRNKLQRATCQGKPRKNRFKWCEQLPSAAHHLFFLLTYLKNNPIQVYHAAAFGLSQPRTSVLLSCCLDSLNQALRRLRLLPCMDSAEYPDFLVNLKAHFAQKAADINTSDLLMDCTEVAVERSVDAKVQEDEFSGKKHNHTLKNLIISLFCGFITFVSSGFSGSTHDKKVADEVNLHFPKNSYLWTDSGFDGYQNSNVNLIQPYKKRRGKELGIEHLHHNYMIGQFRVVNENAIGGMKRCNIIAQQRKTREENVHTKHMSACAGLHNLRILHREKNVWLKSAR